MPSEHEDLSSIPGTHVKSSTETLASAVEIEVGGSLGTAVCLCYLF